MKLRADNPAVAEGRTIHVRTRSVDGPIIRPAAANAKLGAAVVARGAWQGARFFQVTLEERRTCARSCMHWRDCYGNNMRSARRYTRLHGIGARIRREIRDILRKHAQAVVRLHVLGDFPSTAYVRTWATLLQENPGLRIYGYTARPQHTAIGRMITDMNRTHPDQCWIRFSGNVADEREPLRALHAPDINAARELARPVRGFICPEQTGAVRNCAECAACWQLRRPVVFLDH